MLHRLLLADDSVTIQRVIELTFADEDIEVIAVGDGREAIRRIEADRPDIVLADVGMPEKDGYEVAAFVKNTPYLSHIPVLLLTGAFEPVDERRAQQVGCDGVLAKPFEPQLVIARVTELLKAAPPPRAGAAPPVVADRGMAAPAALPAVEPVFDATPAVHVPAAPQVPLDAAVVAAPAPGPKVVEGDPSAIRIGRRTPITVPGFGAPATPAASSSSDVDDYFEKLDAAFATLQQIPFKPESPGVPGAPAGVPSPSSDAIEPVQASPRLASPPVERPLVVAGTGSGTLDHASSIAHAFSALLAAEHGQAIPGPAATVAATATLSAEEVEALVARVASEVAERMSDRVVRDVVTDVVSRIAEKLVREEIDRVKATIK